VLYSIIHALYRSREVLLQPHSSGFISQLLVVFVCCNHCLIFLLTEKNTQVYWQDLVSYMLQWLKSQQTTKLVAMPMKILHHGAGTWQHSVGISCGFIPGVHEPAVTVIQYHTWEESWSLILLFAATFSLGMHGRGMTLASDSTMTQWKAMCCPQT
jgi:hypothetical protein